MRMHCFTGRTDRPPQRQQLVGVAGMHNASLRQRTPLDEQHMPRNHRYDAVGQVIEARWPTAAPERPMSTQLLGCSILAKAPKMMCPP